VALVYCSKQVVQSSATCCCMLGTFFILPHPLVGPLVQEHGLRRLKAALSICDSAAPIKTYLLPFLELLACDALGRGTCKHALVQVLQAMYEVSQGYKTSLTATSRAVYSASSLSPRPPGEQDAVLRAAAPLLSWCCSALCTNAADNTLLLPASSECSFGTGVGIMCASYWHKHFRSKSHMYYSTGADSVWC
jgi:hypothetical protein